MKRISPTAQGIEDGSGAAVDSSAINFAFVEAWSSIQNASASGAFENDVGKFQSVRTFLSERKLEERFGIRDKKFKARLVERAADASCVVDE